jgi:hypothetical protein
MAKDLNTQIADLKVRRDAIITQLSSLTSTSIGGKPNSSGPGSNVQHVSYRLSLYEELQRVRQLIILLEGPIEVDHFGI